MRYLLFLAASVALAADWPSTPFPDWNESTVLKLLTDSPWSRPKTVRLQWVKRDPGNINLRDIPGVLHSPANVNQGLGPLGGIGRGKKETLPDKADILVRWAGSLPVRQAAALYRVREEKLGPEKLNELVGVPEKYAVVELFGLPAGIAHLGTAAVEDIAKRSAYIQIGNAKPVRVEKVEARLNALTLTVRLCFPRSVLDDIKSGDAEVYADLQIFSIREKFRLGSMRYLGRLEL
jgi:hypothetical protein